MRAYAVPLTHAFARVRWSLGRPDERALLAAGDGQEEEGVAVRPNPKPASDGAKGEISQEIKTLPCIWRSQVVHKAISVI